ncbi:hypothetical protein ACWCPQ_34260 [Nocardia sp. NPDC001965]
MKNTLALAMILLGAMLVYSGFKGWTIGETIKFFTGQSDGPAPEEPHQESASPGAQPASTLPAAAPPAPETLSA